MSSPLHPNTYSDPASSPSLSLRASLSKRSTSSSAKIPSDLYPQRHSARSTTRSTRRSQAGTPPAASPYPDAISTSSSTLVNLDSDADRQPWPFDSGFSSSSSSSSYEGYRSLFWIPSLTLSDVGTEDTETPAAQRRRRPSSSTTSASTTASEHLSPRSQTASLRRPTYIEVDVGRSSLHRTPYQYTSPRRQTEPLQHLPRRQCPHDCRCSDQEIELGLCRRALQSSTSSASSSERSPDLVGRQPRALSSGAQRQRRRGEQTEPDHVSPPALTRHRQQAEMRDSTGDRSLRWSGRDLLKDPVVVPKASPRKPHSRSNSQSSPGLVRSLSKTKGSSSLQAGRQGGSGTESDDDVSPNVTSRPQLLARWARRPERHTDETSLRAPDLERALSDELVTSTRRSSRAAVSPPPNRVSSSPSRASLPFDEAGSLSSTASRTATPFHDIGPSNGRSSPRSVPAAATAGSKQVPDRRSIAAVFERMQQEREERLREEQRQRDEKRLQRERERAAWALGWEQRRHVTPPDDEQNGDTPRSVEAADPSALKETVSAFGSESTSTSPGGRQPRSSGSQEAHSEVEPGPSRQAPPPSSTPSPARNQAGLTESASFGWVASTESSSARARALARVRNVRLKRLSAGGSSFGSDQTPAATPPPISRTDSVATGRSETLEESRQAGQSPRRIALEDSSSSESEARDTSGEGAAHEQRGERTKDRPTEERAPPPDASYLQAELPSNVGTRSGEGGAAGVHENSEEESLDDSDGDELRLALDQVMSRSSQPQAHEPPAAAAAGDTPKPATGGQRSIGRLDTFLRPPARSPQLDGSFAFPASRSPSEASPAASSQGGSLSSSPATSPRNTVHRRQRSTVVSLSRNLPGSPAAAARAMNRILGGPDISVMEEAHVSTARRNGELSRVTECSVDSERDANPGFTSDDTGLDTERRKRSVRFSPQPDYRSDSGSGSDNTGGGDGGADDSDGSPDESAAQSSSGGGLRVVNRHHLDAPPSPSPSAEDFAQHREIDEEQEEKDGTSQPQISLAPIERALQLEQESQAHLQGRDEHTAIAPATPNRSVSMHIPGGYVPTPSRALPPPSKRGHVIPTRTKGVHGFEPGPGSQQQQQQTYASGSLQHLQPSGPTTNNSTFHRERNTLPTSPPLPALSLLSSPARNMSPAQRQRLAASRAPNLRPQSASPRGGSGDAIMEEKEVNGSDSLSAVSLMDDSILSSGRIKSQHAYRLDSIPRESTPPRSHATMGRSQPNGSAASARSLSERQTTKTRSLRHNDLAGAVPVDLFVEEKTADEEDSVRITMDQILSALKHKEEEQAKASREDRKTATHELDRAAVKVQAAVEEVIAALPPKAAQPSSRAGMASELVEKAQAIHELASTTNVDVDAAIGKIHTLRDRLSLMISRLGSKLSLGSGSGSEGQVTVIKQVQLQPFYRSKVFLFFAVAFHLVMLWLMMRAAEVRADHLFQTTYYDPFYPDLYVAPPSTLWGGEGLGSTPSFLRHERDGWMTTASTVEGITLASAAQMTGEIIVSLLEGVLALVILPVQVLTFVLWPYHDLEAPDYFVPT